MNCMIKADFTIILLICFYNVEAAVEISERSYMSTEGITQALLVT